MRAWALHMNPDVFRHRYVTGGRVSATWARAYRTGQTHGHAGGSLMVWVVLIHAADPRVGVILISAPDFGPPVLIAVELLYSSRLSFGDVPTIILRISLYCLYAKRLQCAQARPTMIRQSAYGVAEAIRDISPLYAPGLPSPPSSTPPKFLSSAHKYPLLPYAPHRTMPHYITHQTTRAASHTITIPHNNNTNNNTTQQCLRCKSFVTNLLL